MSFVPPPDPPRNNNLGIIVGAVLLCFTIWWVNQHPDNPKPEPVPPPDPSPTVVDTVAEDVRRATVNFIHNRADNYALAAGRLEHGETRESVLAWLAEANAKTTAEPAGVIDGALNATLNNERATPDVMRKIRDGLNQSVAGKQK